MATSSTETRSSSLISPVSSMISVRRSSPKLFWTSLSSLTMRERSMVSEPRSSRYSAMRRWISANSSRIFCCSMPVRRCNWSSMMAWACLSLNWKAAIRPSRASRGTLAARTMRMTSSRWSRAFWKQSKICSRSRTLRSSNSVRRRTTSTRIDEELDAIDQAELAGLPVDDGQHDDAEAGLELGVLVEVVEDHLGLFAALQFEDDAHAVAVAFVADIADAFEFLFVDQGGCGFDEAGLVDLVGNLGDHDLLAVLGQLLDGGAGAQLQLAASGHVGLQDALAAQDEAAGGEIGPLHKLHDFGEGGGGVVDQMDGGVDDLGEVVGREIGRHTDGDAARTVDQ